MTGADPQATRIVVVDDEEIVTSLVRDALEDEGFSISTASSGPEALEIIKSNGVDLIITDIRMPQMDGIELASKARQISPDVVVIFMTGYANLDSAKEAIKQGAFEYIMKPFELTEIRQSVAKAVDKIQRDSAEKGSGQQLERLSDLNEMLYTAGDRNSLAALSLKFAMMHCDSDRGSMLFWDNLRERFQLITILDDQTEEREAPDALMRESLRQADMENLRKPFYFAQIEDHPLYAANPDRALEPFLYPGGVQASDRVAVVPISRADDLV